MFDAQSEYSSHYLAQEQAPQLPRQNEIPLTHYCSFDIFGTLCRREHVFCDFATAIEHVPWSSPQKWSERILLFGVSSELDGAED